MNDRKCKNCGEPIHPHRNKSAQYCTSACREAFFNAKARKAGTKPKERRA
jgi:hypothetical protein